MSDALDPKVMETWYRGGVAALWSAHERLNEAAGKEYQYGNTKAAKALRYGAKLMLEMRDDWTRREVEQRNLADKKNQ